MLDEPTGGQYYGGQVAAPVFSELVQHSLRIMGVQPDISVHPQVVSIAEEEREQTEISMQQSFRVVLERAIRRMVVEKSFNLYKISTSDWIEMKQ